MNRVFLRVLVLPLCAVAFAAGQSRRLIASGPTPDNLPLFVLPASGGVLPGSGLVAPSDRTAPALIAPVALPPMAPELAMQAYQRRGGLPTPQTASSFLTPLNR